MKLTSPFFSLLLFFFTSASFAGGPNDVAKADFSTWPHPFASRQDFNLASRAEILISTLVIQEFEKAGLTKEVLGTKSVNDESVKKWQKEFKERWVSAFRQAAKTCGAKDFACGFQGKTFSDLETYAAEKASEMKALFPKWHENSLNFYRIYMKEQYRLAALFPNPTSEILIFDSSEFTGEEMEDGEFYLSLDDGPTPAKGDQKSDTDAYAKLLRENGIQAFFFALGNALEKRMKSSSQPQMQKLYSDHCLASHGFEHNSHQKWKEWQSSLEKTATIIRQVEPSQKNVHFRPPYGQRTPELISFLSSKNSKNVLWNIDSQDWHSKMQSSDVGSRVKKIMLLKRKGMILFHDVHKKGLTAIPELIDFAKKSSLKWVDCHKML